jgi:hypothetical protein
MPIDQCSSSYADDKVKNGCNRYDPVFVIHKVMEKKTVRKTFAN